MFPQVQGDNASDLDFGAVQRGDPEMEQKMNRVIRACVEASRGNPICSLHDQGAGGNGERRDWPTRSPARFGLERGSKDLQPATQLWVPFSTPLHILERLRVGGWPTATGGEGVAVTHTRTHGIWRPGTTLCLPGAEQTHITTSSCNPLHQAMS